MCEQATNFPSSLGVEYFAFFLQEYMSLKRWRPLSTFLRNKYEALVKVGLLHSCS